jgi:hypothetical protein
MRDTAILATCQKCRLTVLAALCEAVETRCEPTPLTREGELHAAASGRATYRLDGDRRLWRNDQWRILSDAPFPQDHRLAAHVCGQPIPAEWAAPIPDHIRITHQPTHKGEPEW